MAPGYLIATLEKLGLISKVYRITPEAMEKRLARQEAKVS